VTGTKFHSSLLLFLLERVGQQLSACCPTQNLVLSSLSETQIFVLGKRATGKKFHSSLLLFLLERVGQQLSAVVAYLLTLLKDLEVYLKTYLNKV
jgi:hypothetical protein